MIEILTKEDAKDLGFWQMTQGIRPKAEREMLEGIVGDLVKRQIPCCLVRCSSGVQVWRGGEKACYDSGKTLETKTEAAHWISQ